MNATTNLARELTMTLKLKSNDSEILLELIKLGYMASIREDGSLGKVIIVEGLKDGDKCPEPAVKVGWSKLGIELCETGGNGSAQIICKIDGQEFYILWEPKREVGPDQPQAKFVTNGAVIVTYPTNLMKTVHLNRVDAWMGEDYTLHIKVTSIWSGDYTAIPPYLAVYRRAVYAAIRKAYGNSTRALYGLRKHFRHAV